MAASCSTSDKARAAPQPPKVHFLERASIEQVTGMNDWRRILKEAIRRAINIDVADMLKDNLPRPLVHLGPADPYSTINTKVEVSLENVHYGGVASVKMNNTFSLTCPADCERPEDAGWDRPQGAMVLYYAGLLPEELCRHVDKFCGLRYVKIAGVYAPILADDIGNSSEPYIGVVVKRPPRVVDVYHVWSAGTYPHRDFGLPASVISRVNLIWRMYGVIHHPTGMPAVREGNKQYFVHNGKYVARIELDGDGRVMVLAVLSRHAYDTVGDDVMRRCYAVGCRPTVEQAANSIRVHMFCALCAPDEFECALKRKRE
jgi:hypothetical protein